MESYGVMEFIKSNIPMDNKPQFVDFALNKPPKMGGFPSYQLSKPAENQETNYYASLWIINTLLET